MVAKTKSAAAMDDVQAQLRPFLEERGYRWRVRTGNRKTGDGLIHVLNFQMGQRSLQGKFTVNVGVYVPEVARAHFGSDSPSFIHEPTCCIRRRLGSSDPNNAICGGSFPLAGSEFPVLSGGWNGMPCHSWAVRDAGFHPSGVDAT